MTGKVLAPAEVAELREKIAIAHKNSVLGVTSEVFNLAAFCDSHEALRAENARLRGLIEGMVCEPHCSKRFVTGSNCNCIRSKVNI